MNPEPDRENRRVLDEYYQLLTNRPTLYGKDASWGSNNLARIPGYPTVVSRKQNWIARRNKVTGRCDRANHRRERNTWGQSQDVNSRNRGLLLLKVFGPSGRVSRSGRSNRSSQFSPSNRFSRLHRCGGWDGPRIFLRRLAHDEPSASTQAAAKPVRGCSLRRHL